MADSQRSRVAPWADDADPFRDPGTSSDSSSVSEYESSVDGTRDHQPGVPRPVHSGGPRGPRRRISSSNLRTQEPLQPLPPLTQTDPDAILPVRSAGAATETEGQSGISQEYQESITAFSQLVTRRAIPEPLDRSPKNIKAGKRKITATKWIFVIILILLNALFIFATWWWSKYYYILLPFITITVALNCMMVVSVILHTLLHKAFPEKEELPETPESMVLLLPCYNETKEECTKSLDSLVDQANIDDHKKAIMIVCDGQVRGPGMEKTTSQYLLDDVLTGKSTREFIPGAYTAWDHTEMDVTIQRGTYGGIPYFCIIKERNQGKRDSLLLARSFLYNYNIRANRPAVIFSAYFFGVMSSFLSLGAGMDKADLIIGMDADTFFEPACISELLKESHYLNTVGVCGYVTVDFQTKSWSLWRLYQNTEYTISQCLRRLHQSIATHKVSCLPGCCQLLKVSEATCGDRILLERFGYHPTPTDNLLKQIRATASEDRNHVCLMLSTFPKSQTRQALRARAYTDVPISWSVFLSQRRRWTLGATANDLFLIFAPGINIFERVLACANVLTWVLNIFILECIASFIKACTVVHYTLILAFAAVMICPLLYYACISIWQPHGAKSRVQYLMGLVMYFFLGPFLNLLVLCYALWSIDNFAWGKTRKVIATQADGDNEKVTEKPAPGSAQVPEAHNPGVQGADNV